MARIILSVWIYLGSLAALMTTGSLVSGVLSVYPESHLGSFGPVVSHTASQFAAWLPHAPTLLGVAAVVSLLVSGYFWRSGRPRDVKTFAVTLVAAINYFLALFCATSLLIAYFYIPKVANGG